MNKRNLFFALATLGMTLNLRAETYFEQEKEMAKKVLSQKNTMAKVQLRETEATIIKTNEDIKLALYRTAFNEAGDLYIGGIKASPLHSFTADYNFALVIDREQKLPSTTETEFSQLLATSPYRIYDFKSFEEAKSEKALPLQLPSKSELSLVLFSQMISDEKGTRTIFPQNFTLSQCGKIIEPKKSNENARVFFYQEDQACPLQYKFIKGEEAKRNFNFFIMINNASEMVKEQIVRSREVIDRFQRLLRSENKKATPDADKVAEYTKKIASQELELRRLKQFLRGVSE